MTDEVPADRRLPERPRRVPDGRVEARGDRGPPRLLRALNAELEASGELVDSRGPHRPRPGQGRHLRRRSPPRSSPTARSRSSRNGSPATRSSTSSPRPARSRSPPGSRPCRAGRRPDAAAHPGAAGHGRRPSDVDRDGGLPRAARVARAERPRPPSRTCCASWRRRSSARSRAGRATSTRPRTPSRRRCSPPPTTGRATASRPTRAAGCCGPRAPADRPAAQRAVAPTAARPASRVDDGPTDGRRPGRHADAPVPVLPPGADAGLRDRADAARGRRPDDRGDRPRVPRARGDDGAADLPGQAADRGLRRAVPDADGRGAPGPPAGRSCTCST